MIHVGTSPLIHLELKLMRMFYRLLVVAHRLCWPGAALPLFQLSVL